MGMFDSVYVKCECGEEVEFQSKAGECCLSEYRIGDDIPVEILIDIRGDVGTCMSCGNMMDFPLGKMMLSFLFSGRL